MSSIESPLNTAHNHASNAEDLLAQGLLIPAAEEHYKAAEAFLACVEQSTDENTKRTLKMLYNDHCKAGKELQRKIAKLREENKDPTLPQKPSPSAASSSNATPSNVPQPPQPIPSPPPYTRSSPMSDSQGTVDESFMVLGQRSDPGDAFNQFWKIMEGMLDNLSQPVAFATAPLGTAEASSLKRRTAREASSSSDTDAEETLTTRLSRKLGMVRNASSRMLAADDTSGSQRDLKKPQQTHLEVRDDFDEEFLTDEGKPSGAGIGPTLTSLGGELSESFCLIPSGPEPSAAALKKENISLKAEIEAVQQRLAATERVLQLRKEQDQHLRDSIMMARREAQRAMGASTVLRPGQGTIDFSSLNINLPPVPAPVTNLNSGRDREAQLLRRIRELEEELRGVRADNDKQKVMIARFRERWEKLKESAKRKKDAKAAAEAALGVRERIVEEPEAEQELDGQP